MTMRVLMTQIKSMECRMFGNIDDGMEKINECGGNTGRSNRLTIRHVETRDGHRARPNGVWASLIRFNTARPGLLSNAGSLGRAWAFISGPQAHPPLTQTCPAYGPTELGLAWDRPGLGNWTGPVLSRPGSARPGSGFF